MGALNLAQKGEGVVVARPLLKGGGKIPDAVRLLLVRVEPAKISAKPETGSAFVEGHLNVYIYYQTRTGKQDDTGVRVPFQVRVPMPGVSAQTPLRAEIADLKHKETLGPDEHFEQQIELTLHVRPGSVQPVKESLFPRSRSGAETRPARREPEPKPRAPEWELRRPSATESEPSTLEPLEPSDSLEPLEPLEGVEPVAALTAETDSDSGQMARAFPPGQLQGMTETRTRIDRVQNGPDIVAEKLAEAFHAARDTTEMNRLVELLQAQVQALVALVEAARALVQELRRVDLPAKAAPPPNQEGQLSQSERAPIGASHDSPADVNTQTATRHPARSGALKAAIAKSGGLTTETQPPLPVTRPSAPPHGKTPDRVVTWRTFP